MLVCLHFPSLLSRGWKDEQRCARNKQITSKSGWPHLDSPKMVVLLQKQRDHARDRFSIGAVWRKIWDYQLYSRLNLQRRQEVAGLVESGKSQKHIASQKDWYKQIEKPRTESIGEKRVWRRRNQFDETDNMQNRQKWKREANLSALGKAFDRTNGQNEF